MFDLIKAITQLLTNLYATVGNEFLDYFFLKSRVIASKPSYQRQVELCVFQTQFFNSLFSCSKTGQMLVEAWGWGYLPCLLAVLVLCSVTLTWDAPLFTPHREHYVSQAHFHGVDVFTEALHSPVGPEQFMEHFYVCYGRDGRKTYFKKQDQNYFSNRRFWVISSSGKFVASMRTC